MDPFRALAEMRDMLEEALALFDQLEADDEDAPAAIGRISAAIKSGPDPSALRLAVSHDELERFDDELEDLVRLNAVLTAAITSDREALVGRLKSVRESRRDLRYYSAGGRSGARCDVAG